MKRIVVTTFDEQTGQRRSEGHFDYERATVFAEDRDWDGNNHISVNTGSQWEHEALIHTAGGRWVLHFWSDWQGTLPGYRYIDADDARDWLLRNGKEEALAQHFGEAEEEVGPGRPAVGGPTTLRFPPDLRERIDAKALPGETFAATVRRLLEEAVAEPAPEPASR